MLSSLLTSPRSPPITVPHNRPSRTRIRCPGIARRQTLQSTVNGGCPTVLETWVWRSGGNLGGKQTRDMGLKVGIWEAKRQGTWGWTCTDPQGSCWHRGVFGVIFALLVMPGWISTCHSWTWSLWLVFPISSVLTLWSEVHLPLLSKGNVLNPA